MTMIRHYLTRLFAPPPPRVAPSTRERDLEHENDRLRRALYDSQFEAVYLKRRVESMEHRVETAEAKRHGYSGLYAELRAAALPVSLLLVEGEMAQAAAINARLWDLVKPEGEA